MAENDAARKDIAKKYQEIEHVSFKMTFCSIWFSQGMEGL